MRRGYNGEILFDGDKFVGVNLGADYCAEHEWGIERLCKYLGVYNHTKDNEKAYLSMKDNIQRGLGYDPVFGVEARTITNTDNLLATKHILKGKTVYALYCGANYFLKHCSSKLSDEIKPWNDEWEISGAWSEHDFGFIVRNRKIINDLVDAANKHNLFITTAGGGPFENGGLKLLIASRMPDGVLDKMYKADADSYDLLTKAYGSGIYDELKQAGKQFFALSPRLDDNGELIFWLNPHEQDKYHACWCTLQDLRDWINDTGKIIIKKTRR